MNSQSQDELNIECVSGTTFEAVTLSLEVNGSAPASALTAGECKLYKGGALTLTVPFTILNAATWSYRLGPVAAATMTIDEGIHTGAIKLTDAAGTVTKDVVLNLTVKP